MYKIYETLRNERGLTDFQVAKKTGISTATLSHWKAGFYTPKFEKISKIAALFNVPVEVFYKAEEEKKVVK